MTKNITQQAILDADPEIASAFFQGKRFVPQKLAQAILEAHPLGTFLTPKTDQGGDTIWMYDQEHGIFQEYGIPWIKETMYKILGRRCKSAHQNEVVNLLKTATYIHPADFIETPEIVVLKDCCYNLITGEPEPFNPEYKARSALPVTYNPDADCPTVKAFLTDIIPGNEDFMQEWFGYHLLKDYRYQRCVVLLGEGDNGKSTLLNLITAFLGSDNVSGENLYRISTNRFSPAELNGKLANIAADIGPAELKHTGIIKMLTGGDLISAEKKNHQPFKFRNHAKLSFSCNQLPKTPDITLAFYKRFIVIVFEKIIPPDKQDSQLLEKMTTQEELSGLFNWAVEGLRRTRERGTLNEPTDILTRKELYTMMSDPVIGFVNECILQTYGDEYIEKDDTRRVFVSWCRQKGVIPIGDVQFYKALKDNLYLKETQIRVGDRRPRVYKGLSWTDQALSVTGVTNVTASSIPLKKIELNIYSGSKETRDNGDTGDTPPITKNRLPVDLSRLITVVGVMVRKSGDAVKGEDLASRLKWEQEHFNRVLGIAMKDGTIYSPRPGYYRVS